MQWNIGDVKAPGRRLKALIVDPGPGGILLLPPALSRVCSVRAEGDEGLDHRVGEDACPTLSLWRALPELDCSGLGYPASPVVEVSRLDHLPVSWGQGLRLPALDNVPTMGAGLS